MTVNNWGSSSYAQYFVTITLTDLFFSLQWLTLILTASIAIAVFPEPLKPHRNTFNSGFSTENYISKLILNINDELPISFNNCFWMWFSSTRGFLVMILRSCVRNIEAERPHLLSSQETSPFRLKQNPTTIISGLN